MFPESDFKVVDTLKSREALEQALGSLFSSHLEKLSAKIGRETRDALEREVLLKAVDMAWMDHIDNMDQLKPVSYTHLDVYKRQVVMKA